MRFDWQHLQNWVPGVARRLGGDFAGGCRREFPDAEQFKTGRVAAITVAASPAKDRTSRCPGSCPNRLRLKHLRSLKRPRNPLRHRRPLRSSPQAKRPSRRRCRVMRWSWPQAEPAAPPEAAAVPEKGQQNAVAANAAGLQGDAAAGRQVFKKCQACHSLEPGKTILGPSLAGIVGRKSAADANFSYSPAMKQAALTWDPPTLDAYLADPAKIVPGNRMPFPGLKTDHDRKDVIAFLAAPAAPAARRRAAAKAAAPSAPAAAAPQAKSGRRLPPISRMRSSPCAPESRKEKWSFSALAAPSTARPIRF